MTSNMSNGKTYTEVVLEFSDRLDAVEQRIITRLDSIVAINADCKERLARGDAKFAAIDDKIDGKGGVNERIDENANEIGKVRNLNTLIALIASTIAGIIGVNK